MDGGCGVSKKRRRDDNSGANGGPERGTTSDDSRPFNKSKATHLFDLPLEEQYESTPQDHVIAELGESLPIPALPISGHSTESWLHPTRPLVDLTDRIERGTAILCGGGRFGDVYRCNYREPSGSASLVAVKSFRCFVSPESDSDEINRDIRRELGLWRRLDGDCENIVPLLGVARGFGPLDAIVSAWMPNGTLHSFLEGAGETYSLNQRLSVLLGIGSCLVYLHSIPVLHGDLTSSNILIDEQCNPRLTDFGLSSALEKFQTGMTYLVRRSTDPGALRWAAPELFDDECKPSPSADIYSFGCIMLEVLSGKIPWDGKPERVVIGLKIVQRRFPDRPTSPNLREGLWDLIVKCWSLPGDRPSAKRVINDLTTFRLLGRLPQSIGVARCSYAPHSTMSSSCAPPSAAPQPPTVYFQRSGTPLYSPSNLSIKFLGQRRALLITIQRVHGYSYDQLDYNHFAHRDANTLLQYLSRQGYASEDIVDMRDAHLPMYLWPSRENILKQIDQLVNGASEIQQYFFYYSGHVLPECGDTMRPRRNIITADGESISNDLLHERLVTQLARVKGSKLFALFDCGHSETILDLDKEAEDGAQQHGVISLCASRDAEDARGDHERGLTFTKMFLDTLTARPNVTWLELRDDLKSRVSEMRARCMTRLQRLRERDGVAFEEWDQWTQEPRYHTTRHVDLTTKVSF